MEDNIVGGGLFDLGVRLGNEGGSRQIAAVG